jgi:ABC-type branched-subunit amino acid transport system ATPase component
VVHRLRPTLGALEDDGMAVPLVGQFAALALGVADDAVVLAGG